MLQHHEQITNQKFFDAHRQDVKELFDVLGHTQEWTNDLPGIIAYTQENWVRGDHWKPDNKEVFSQEQAQAVREISSRMGLVDEIQPPQGEYDQLIILGGMMRANTMRTQFASQLLQSPAITVKKDAPIIFWGGPRPTDPFETAWIQEAAAGLDQAGNDAAKNGWWQKQQQLHGAATVSAEHTLLADELAEGRAALLRSLGNLPLSQMHVSITDITKNRQVDLPENLINRYLLKQPESKREVILLNAPTVHRPQGADRHTTESAATMWLDDISPPVNARVLFVTSNPYIPRTTQVVQKLLEKHGRSDVTLEGCGTAAYDDARVQLFLGEVGRLLYEDSQAG